MFEPEVIYVEPLARNFALTESVLSRFPDVPVRELDDMQEVQRQIQMNASDTFGAAKRHLALTCFKGSFLKKCPGISPGMVCCNYYVVNLIKNCVYDCSYCFLQEFLENNSLLTVFVNIEDLFDELREIFSSRPDNIFRVGTGELTDSLALDRIVPHTDFLIPFFEQFDNAVLELKTKSDQVDNLLRYQGTRNIIISWSINPREIAELEEKGTPGLDQRLQAARRCQDHGYRIGFHFDPIIIFPGWEQAYKETVDQLFDTVSPSAIEWISLGSFRYKPRLKQIIKDRHRDSLLFTQEHVPSEDGKYRYLRPLRNHAYETIRGFIREKGKDLSVYLCMESKEIWQGVTGKLPRSDAKLDQFFDL